MPIKIIKFDKMPFLKEKYIACLFLLLGLAISKKAVSQPGSVKTRLFISSNLIQIPVNEISLYVDYSYRKKHSFGINGGIIYAVKMSGHIPFQTEDDFPGAAWDGFVARANYKLFYNSDKGSFLCLQGIYKGLSYSNRLFMDKSIYSNTTAQYTRSENAWLAGLDFIHGHSITNERSALFIEVYYGVGVRYRERHYTTLTSTLFTDLGKAPPNATQDPGFPIGEGVKKQIYPTLILGVKMGWTHLFRQK